MPSLLSNAPCSWHLGGLAENNSAFQLSEEQLSRHLGVFGGSGSGKSKFLELLCRRMLDDYRGFCFIDPHGDTVEDILTYAAKRSEAMQSDAVFKRIHLLEPTYETVFGFDPFEFRHTEIPDEHRGNAYHAWLHAKADKISEIVQRKQGQSDFQGMARLQRILRDVLIAVGTPVFNGEHLPLSDVLVLLDSHNPRHEEILALVLPHLPPEVRADFESLAAYRSEEQRKKETESTINRLRSLLSPIVKAIFASSAETIDFRKIIMNRGIVLVNLRKTDFFSADQRNAIGGLLIHELLSTVETCPRDQRAPYYLIVDEARLFIGEDMMEALDQARKFKLSVCLAGQYLSQFKTEEFDMTPSILNNCGTIICFQQKHPDDLDIWKQYFGYSNLNFEKHFQIVDRQKGFDYLEVEDYSESSGTGSSTNVGTNRSSSSGSGSSYSYGTSQERGWSSGNTEGVSNSDSLSNSSSDMESDGRSRREAPIISDRSLYNTILLDSEDSKRSRSRQETHGRTSGTSQSWSESESGSQGRSENWGNSTNRSTSVGGSWGSGTSQNQSKTTTFKTVPVPHLEEERHESPSLQNSVEDQFHKFAKLQRSLPQRFALVSLAGLQESFVINVAQVDPPFAPADTAAKITAAKTKIFALHPYNSKPDLSPNSDRLDQFLNAHRLENLSPEPEKPPVGDSPFDT